MPKEITTEAQNKASTPYGTETSVIIEVQWGGSFGTKYYAEKTFTIGTKQCLGSILDIGSLVSQIKVSSSAQISSIDFSLDDLDGSLKSILNTKVAYRVPCIAYLYFVGVEEADLIVLYRGYINKSTWDESKRVCDFSCDSILEDKEIGFALSDGDYSSDVLDKAWPLCFGIARRVPAVFLNPATSAKVTTPFNEESTSFKVDSSEEFDQGEPITISVSGIWIRGVFEGDTFTINEINLPKFASLDIAARDLADADNIDSNVFWLADSTNYIAGNYVLIVTGTTYSSNFCYKQVGAKCWFQGSWREGEFAGMTQEDTGFLVGPTSKIMEVCGLPRRSWPNINNGITNYYFKSGETIYLNTNLGTYNIVCCTPTTSIKEVLAYRNIEGRQELTAVPSSYYTKFLNTAVEGQVCTYIRLIKPLTERIGEKWDSNELYVTVESSIGPNAVDIIQYLIETYSDMTVDLTSFNAIALLLENYPANFAIFDKDNLLSVIEDIAWQARCALRYEGTKVYIQYLSLEPDSELTIGESGILLDTMAISFSDSENLVTKVTARWQPNYTTPEHKIVKVGNIDLYGTREDEWQITIFNKKSLVEKTVDFWFNRVSNLWKNVSFITPVDTIKLDSFDCITLDSSHISTIPVKGIVQNAEYNSTTNEINYNIWLPVLSGTMEVSSLAWDADDEDMPIYLDCSEVDYEILVWPPGGGDETDNKKNYMAVIKTVLNQYRFKCDIYKNGYLDGPTARNVEVRRENIDLDMILYAYDLVEVEQRNSRNWNIVKFIEESGTAIIGRITEVLSPPWFVCDLYEAGIFDAVTLTCYGHKYLNQSSLYVGCSVSGSLVYDGDNSIFYIKAIAHTEATQMFKFVSQSGDYLNCHTWDGVTEGTAIIKVAKIYNLRRSSYDGKTIDLVHHTYTANTERTCTKGAITQYQKVIPAYAIGEEIKAQFSLGGTGVPDVYWIESTNKAWAVRI